MYWAIGVDPTKPTPWIVSLSRIASTASLSPLITCRTPSGSPASCISSARRSAVEGHRSEGFRIIAFPQASAGPIFHSGIIAGKLKGVMPATTPSGWRMEYRSMPGPPSLVNSPFSSEGAPMQTSITSRPRCTSPRASGSVLPCSRLTSSANSSICSTMRVPNFIITRALRCGFVAPHAFCASAAASTALFSSSRVARGTLACTSPVAGLYTSANRPELPLTCLPFIQCVSSCMESSYPLRTP